MPRKGEPAALPLIANPPRGRARDLARQLGVCITVFVYDRKSGPIWMFRYEGREVGSYVVRTGWCRVLHEWQQQRSALEAVRMVARVLGLRVEQQQRRRKAA